MKTNYWLVLGFVVAGGLQIAACSSNFASCESSRDCPTGAGGSATDAVGGAVDSSPGGNGNPLGEVGDPTGGGGTTVGGAHDGPSELGGADTGGAVNCDASLDACGGTCVDLDKDAKNCGVCGHDCLGGDCTLGVCQPIEIAKDQGRLLMVALDEQFIYWGGDGAVVGKKSIDNSGKVIVLVPTSTPEYAYFGTLVGQTFYWVNGWKDNGVRGCKLPTCAGGPGLLIAGTVQPESVAYGSQAATLFWPQGASIWHKVFPAGSAEQFITTTLAAHAIKTDESFVYWTEAAPASSVVEIRKVPLTGGGSSSLATGLKDVEDMAPYGKNLYLLTNPSSGGASIGTIALPNGIGSASPKPFAAAGASAIALRVDESGVYWTQRDGTNGTIRHCPLTGCSVDSEILAPTTTPWGIATDAKAIYWTTEDGFVMKLAK